MPWSCQYATKDIQSYDPPKKEESTILLNLKINKTQPVIFTKSDKAGYAANSLRNSTLISSTKETGGAGCDEDGDGKPDTPCTVNGPSLPVEVRPNLPVEISGYIEPGQQDDEVVGTRRKGKKGGADQYSNDLQYFLKEKSNCLESLKKLGVDIDKFQQSLNLATNGIEVKPGSELWNKTFAELGFNPDPAPGITIGEFPLFAATNIDRGDFYYKPSYFDQPILERGLTVFHEALHHFLKAYNHESILAQLKLPPAESYTIQTEGYKETDLTGKVTKINPPQTFVVSKEEASSTALDKWLRDNCPIQ